MTFNGICHSTKDKLNCFIDETFSREIVFWPIKVLYIGPVNFNLSLVVLPCFSDMAVKERKIANSSFRKTSHENKFSEVVKLVERWVTKVYLESCRASMMELFCENS